MVFKDGQFLFYILSVQAGDKQHYLSFIKEKIAILYLYCKSV